MGNVFSPKLSDCEIVWHWCLWCLCVAVQLGDSRVPTALILSLGFALHAFITRPDRSFLNRLFVCSLSGCLAISELSLQVSQCWSIKSPIVGAICGLAASFSPAIIRYFFLSIALALCASPLVRTVLIGEALGFPVTFFSSEMKPMIGFAEMFALGIPGVVYCFYENLRSIDVIRPVEPQSERSTPL